MASAQANIRTFIAPLKGSGRLAPTLIEDLTLYDPCLNSPPGRNLLEDPPVNFGNTNYLHQVIPQSSCRHAFYLQPRRTQAPRLDEIPDQTSVYIVTAFCRLCRIHVSLTVDYTRNWKGSPCPKKNRPVHHLIHSIYNQDLAKSNLEREYPNATDQIFVYQCSSPGCGVIVTVQLGPAVLSSGEVHTLTDPDLLRQRTDEAFEVRKGDVEGMKRPSPTDVLSDLRAYIRNSWSQGSKGEIAVDNKRFAVRFGPNGTACASVLTSLGFRLRTGEPGAWVIPRPSMDDSQPLKDVRNVFLDNLEHELSSLIISRPVEERQTAQDTTKLEDAGKEFSRALSCQSYDQAPSSRTVVHMASNRPSPFIVLGAPEDISDELICDAYDWQCTASPEYGPTFLSALRDIANIRNSEILHTKFASEQSLEKVTVEELARAYRSLGFPEIPQSVDIDESHIIGSFNARLQDSPAHEADLRANLRVIGLGLQSSRIVDYASREITTYEQALDFLDAQADSADDWIESLYTVKLTENPGLKDLAQKAVKIIAMTRGSNALNNWVASDFTREVSEEMDVGEAFTLLGIADRTIDDATILVTYNFRKEDDPGNTQRIDQALRAIAKERNSAVLQSHMQMVPLPRSDESLQEPVGLDNIGNTCYLNSLLQSFFTIRGFREVVLDFEKYKMDPTPENMAVKKVGQRKISRKEVETAQKFVINLANLFRSMITSPKPAIRPEQELARLALETETMRERIRRRSTLAGANRPNLVNIDNVLSQGPNSQQSNGITEATPLLSPIATETPSDEEFYKELGQGVFPNDASMHDTTDNGDNSSEVTLVSKPSSEDHMDMQTVSVEQQQSILDNKENLPPMKIPELKSSQPPETVPLRPASPSKINAQAGALANMPNSPEMIMQEPVDDSLEENTFEHKPPVYAPPPGPPPVPPRKPVEPSMPTLESYASQQDVTEVFGHCVIQLSNAIKPTGFDKSGEQKDQIHDLFFGDERRHVLSEKEIPEALPFLYIIAQVHNHPKDVYAALDNYFDLSDSGRGDYISVKRLPPVLTVAFQRVGYERASVVKHEDYIEMPELIYMDRYIDAGKQSDLMQKRIRSWEVKERLVKLTEQKLSLEQEHAGAKDVPGLYDDAKRALLFLRESVAQEEEFGGPIDFDPSLPDILGELANKARDQLRDITAEIEQLNQELTNMFKIAQDHPYQLHSVCFHRGGPGSGHYWVYIKDHQSGIWRKYNDDHVTVVKDTTEIFGKPEITGGWGRPANAYFLVYAKVDDNGNVDNLVETVKREPLIEEEPDMDLIPLGSTEQDYAKGPSQMTEMPPNNTWNDSNSIDWVAEPDHSNVQEQKDGNWDNSEASNVDPNVWYR